MGASSNPAMTGEPHPAAAPLPSARDGRIESRQLRDGEAAILEMISSGAPLAKILDTITSTMDAASIGNRTTILVVDKDGQRLRTGAAPLMPPTFIEAIDGLPIAEGSAVCGTAAYRRAPVYVEDVETDPLCAAVTGLAAANNIRACWSVPAIDSHGEAIATLALYASEPGLPTPQDISLLQRAAHLASIAIERARDEKALRDNEALLRMALHVGRMGAWRIDLPSDLLTWSAEVYDIFEVPSDFQPTLENALSFYAEEQQGQVAEAIGRCIADGTTFNLELPLTSAKGNNIWVRVMGEAVRDEHGELLCIQGATQDISPRKRSELRAKAIEDRLVKTLETISEAFITLDREWRFTYINLEAEKLLKRTRASLLGKVVWDEYPQAGGPDFENAYRTAVATGKPVEFEAHYPGLDSWFCVRAIPSSEGLAVYFNDITGAREAREILAVSEERFRLLSKATSDAIWDWDLSTNTLWWSDGFEAMFGYRLDEIPSTIEFWTSLIHPSEAKRVEDSIHAVIDGQGQQWTSEYRFLRKDGEYAYVHDRGYVLRDAEGKAFRMIGGITDHTDQKRIEDQLLRTQRMESIGTLASGIAHDLNNILAPILMSAELLKGDVRTPEAVATLDAIATSARRGADLIKQVLGFARGMDGKPLLLDISSTAREIQKIIRDTFPRNIELLLDVPSGLWRVNADPTQLHQVLMNLCVNARDAMPAGGILKLTIQNLVLDEIFVGVNLQAKPGPYILINVSDTGIGMPREVQEKIFEPFFTTKEVGKGTGLGLSTTFSIVKNHGGFMNVYSEPGKGTKFKVYLPACTDAESAADGDEALPPASALPTGSGELILLVDDEVAVRDITRKALERYGYRVLTAANGAEGVSTYVQHRDNIAVILTDMSMPIMDGPAMIIALKSINPSVKIIGSSGLAANGDVAKALGAGVEHFVPKPYTAELLLKTLRIILEKDGRESPAPAPACAPAAPAPAPAEEQTPTQDNAHVAHVLLVDDEIFLRHLAQRMLKVVGCTVICAGNGREALELLKTGSDQIDIVVTDLNMPELDGADFYREAIKIYPHLRFIFTSGTCEVPESLIQEVGPTLCSLPKPYSSAELSKAIQTVLAQQPLDL